MASTTVLNQAPEISLQAQENRRLRQRIHDYEAIISARDAQILERDKQLSILNDSRHKLENQIQTASQTIHHKDNEIEDLNNRIHEQDSQLRALNESHATLKEQSKAHENIIEIQKWDIGELLGKERSSDAVILQWGPLIQELEAQNDDKDRKLRRLRDANARNRNNVNLIEALQAENAQKDLELRRLREENAGQLEASVTESNKLRLTVQQLNNENSCLKQRASELEKEAREAASLAEKVKDPKAKAKFYAEKNDDRRSETRHSSSKSKGKKSHSRRG